MRTTNAFQDAYPDKELPDWGGVDPFHPESPVGASLEALREAGKRDWLGRKAKGAKCTKCGDLVLGDTDALCINCV